ncbi:unnamed protein product [Polarella glacialis]|uniref:Uncharacterized protein n=1 Tax=Polarella glacialis TaxID=89957 RepID=A0A813GLF7_POLGL|nr:unnamed protein product [Polarella glacialis]CAE8685199.1 unnamed protein product [Polarella glacialis]
MWCSWACLATVVINAIICQGAEQHHGPSSSAGNIRTPSLFVGECKTTWTSAVGSYALPYSVNFTEYGTYSWSAPFADKPGAEFGEGVILMSPVITELGDGSWTARYMSATRFAPGRNIITCACEYLSWSSSDAPRVISDYGIAEVPGTDGPIEEVCAPHLEYACPIDNATAFKKLGSPFIEYYSECTMPDDSSVKDRSDALSETTKAWLENKLPKKLEFASESPATPSMVGGALVGVVLLAFAFSGIVFSQRVDRETEVDVYHAYEGQGGCSTAEGVA